MHPQKSEGLYFLIIPKNGGGADFINRDTRQLFLQFGELSGDPKEDVEASSLGKWYHSQLTANLTKKRKVDTR